MDLQEPLTVFVPRSDSLPTILDGSGIVGSPHANAQPIADEPWANRWRIDYEGNKYGASNIVTFADRVHHAAGRHVQNYPTVARMIVQPQQLLPVATFDGHRVQIDGQWSVSDGLALFKLAEWLGCGRYIGGMFRPNSVMLDAELHLSAERAR